MFVCALATIVSADAFKGAHNPKTLALWCLVFKLALLPFFLTMTLIVLVLGSYFFAQRGLIFVTFIMLPCYSWGPTASCASPHPTDLPRSAAHATSGSSAEKRRTSYREALPLPSPI